MDLEAASPIFRDLSTLDDGFDVKKILCISAKENSYVCFIFLFSICKLC